MELLNFDSFKHEQQLNEVKTVWNGRFSNLDKILSYNYELMKDSDKKLKDTIFRAYYRYYNDGDVNTFPKGILNKVGVPEDVSKILGDSEIKSNIRWDNKQRFSRQSKSSYTTNYEKAMDEAIKYVFKYFTTKYPEFFKSEGRQKTYAQWKNELMKYATEKPTELSTYWVSQFGKQFGIDELKQYNPYAPENKGKDNTHTITDTKTILKVIELMLDSIKKKDESVNESVVINEDAKWYIEKGYTTDETITSKEDLFKTLNENLTKSFIAFSTKHKLDMPNPVIKIEDSRNKTYISLKSDKITGDALGIFKKCMAAAEFNFFSGRTVEFADVDAKFMFKPYIWCTLNLGYSSIHGGTNGLDYMIDDNGNGNSLIYDIKDKEFYKQSEYTKY